MTIKSTIKAARKILEDFNNVELLAYEDQVGMMRVIVKMLDDDQKVVKASNILECIMSATDADISDLESFELAEHLTKLLDDVIDCDEIDEQIEIGGGEVRIISDDHIDQVWTDGLIEITKECYEGLNDLPSFVAIDWEATATNCKVDGMGHHFSSYDGEEHESEGFHIFRTN